MNKKHTSKFETYFSQVPMQNSFGNTILQPGICKLERLSHALTNNTMSRVILSFIRLTDQGLYEKVTWSKQAGGEKTVTKNFIKPTREQAQKIATSVYQEIAI